MNEAVTEGMRCGVFVLHGSLLPPAVCVHHVSEAFISTHAQCGRSGVCVCHH